MGKLKLAIFIPTLNGGGAERAAINLANGLFNLNIEIILLTGNADGVNREHLNPEIQIIDFQVTRLLFTVGKLRDFMKQNRCDYIISFLNHTNILVNLVKMTLIFNKCHTKVINTVHSITSNAIKKKYQRGIFSVILKKSYRTICVSKAVKMDLLQNFSFNEGDLSVIYNPLYSQKELKLLESLANSNKRIENSLISVGRLEIIKDYPTLIEAIRILKKDYNMNITLDIYGEGSQKNQLYNMIKELDLENQIKLRGYSQEIFEKYSQFEVFVLPSLYEGFGNVVIEALASGTKVIYAEGSGGPEELLGENHLGIVFEKQNSKSLASAIYKAINNENKVKESKAFVQQFTNEKIAQEYLNLL